MSRSDFQAELANCPLKLLQLEGASMVDPCEPGERQESSAAIEEIPVKNFGEGEPFDDDQVRGETPLHRWSRPCP
jgi:hypothetical protein